jgi:hypothetical protein
MTDRDSINQSTKPPDFLEADRESDNQLLSEKYKKEYSSSLFLNYVSASYKVLMYAGVVVLASWLSYQQGKVDGRGEANLTEINSDNESTVIVPDDPGGLKIPNQDLTIYESGKDEETPEEEQINQTIPSPDAPIMRAEPENEISQSEINQIMEDLSDNKNNQVTDDPEPKKETEEIAVDDQSNNEIAVDDQNNAEEENFVANIAEDLRSVSPSEAIVYRIQLASLTSKIIADNEMLKIQNKLANVLADLELKIYPVEIEGRGTYFRIQAGPINTSKEAKNLCNEIIRLQEKCFVVNLGQVE